jgi:DNA-binding transcriptional regulator PaaX
MKLHQKGFLLVTLGKNNKLWDDELIVQAFIEYNISGDYCEKTLRIALDELSAAGLITRVEEKLESNIKQAKLLFRYQLSDFGRARMIDTGLLNG